MIECAEFFKLPHNSWEGYTFLPPLFPTADYKRSSFEQRIPAEFWMSVFSTLVYSSASVCGFVLKPSRGREP